MRTLMIGAGAVGGYVGGRLAQAGREVDFLVRPRRAAQLVDGLRIVDGAQTELIGVRTVTSPYLSGPYDLILVCVKAQALATAIEDFKPAVGPETAVLPFLNGINHIDTLTQAFGDSAVLGGTLKIGTQLEADGAIRQLMPGGSIELGELDGANTNRVAAISEELTIPGFTVTVPKDITDAMWTKWVFIAAIGAVTSLAHGTVGEISATTGGTTFAEHTLDEAASVARAAGYPLSEDSYAFTRAIVTAKGAPITSSLSRDLLADQPTEVENVLGDLITLAHGFGLPVPRIEAAALTLRVHNSRKATRA